MTELELKTLLLRKKKTGRYLERSDLTWLCREIWRKRRALKREKHLDKIKESAEMVKAPKKTQSKHFNWNSIAKDENPESVLTKFFLDFYSIPEDQEESTQSERRHWVELWKNMRMDCAGGMLISPKKLENVLKKLKNGKGSPDQITADVLKALPPDCLEKLARSLSLTCWDMNFPEDWLCSLTVMAPKVVGATCLTKFRPRAGLCAMRKVLGYVWLKSLPPLRYESVQTAFVPKTHADTGLFLLLKAAELSREWQREIVVVQLDVKKAFDHVDHRAAFRAMKLQGVSLFSMALIAAIWNGSCMKARLGTVTSNKVQMSRGLPQGAPESPVIFTLIMELVLRDLIKSWISRKLAWRLDDFTLAAICYADDVVLIAVSVSAAEKMVSEVIEKLKEVGLTVGAQKTHWTSFPEDDGQKHHARWIGSSQQMSGCGVGGSFGVCGIDGVSGRECKTCDRTQNSSSQQMSGEIETCVEFSMALQIVAAEHCKDYTTMWQAFLWSSSVWTTVKAQRDINCELERENGGECYWIGVRRPPGMELGQWWRLWHRTGHRWIEICNMNVLVAIRDRMLSWAGHVARMDYKEICAKALRCRGLQWWRWRQLNWKEVERDKWSGPHPERFKNLQSGRTWLLGRSPSLLETQMVCRILSRTMRDGCILLKTVETGSSSRNVERALCRRSRVPRGPKCVRHDWDECRCCLVDNEKESEMVQSWLWLTGFVWQWECDLAAMEFLRTFYSARRAEWFSGDVMRKC